MMSTENQIPSQEWLKKYEKVKSILVPPVSFEEIYSQKEAFGKKLFILNMGEVHFPTGEILVRDPLYFLHHDQLPYFQKVHELKYFYQLKILLFLESLFPVQFFHQIQ